MAQRIIKAAISSRVDQVPYVLLIGSISRLNLNTDWFNVYLKSFHWIMLPPVFLSLRSHRGVLIGQFGAADNINKVHT